VDTKTVAMPIQAFSSAAAHEAPRKLVGCCCFYAVGNTAGTQY